MAKRRNVACGCSMPAIPLSSCLIRRSFTTSIRAAAISSAICVRLFGTTASVPCTTSRCRWHWPRFLFVLLDVSTQDCASSRRFTRVFQSRWCPRRAVPGRAVPLCPLYPLCPLGINRPRRLLTIGHSYCVDLNRRLPQELARLGEWDVTAVAPLRFRGDFGWHSTQTSADERCRVMPVSVRFSRRVHTMLYGTELTRLLQQPWDLVHCWEEPYVASAAQIARAAALRVPLVFATFQNIVKRYPPPFNWIERSALGRADGVIAFGQTARHVLDARGWSQPARTIPPGVDVDRFRPDPDERARVRHQLGWTDGVPVVGFLG